MPVKKSGKPGSKFVGRKKNTKPFKHPSIFSGVYSPREISRALSKTRRNVLLRPAVLKTKKGKTNEGLFVDFLRKAKKEMTEKGKIPENFPLFFVKNVYELISVLPEKDLLRQKLINEIRKDSSYDFSSDKAEYHFKEINLAISKGNKPVPVFVVFLGNLSGNALKKQFKRMANMIADVDYRTKLETRAFDKLAKNK